LNSLFHHPTKSRR